MSKKMSHGNYILKHRLIHKYEEYKELGKSKRGRNTKKYHNLKKEFQEYYLIYKNAPCRYCHTGETETCKAWCYTYKIWLTGKNINRRRRY